MPKSFAQAKGARFERFFAKEIQEVVDSVYDELGLEERPIIQRNTLQSHLGGHDLVGLPSLAVENKHCEKLEVDKWWEQCLRQTKPGQIPVLAYRQNNVRTRCVMFGYIETDTTRVKARVDISLAEWKVWLRQHVLEQSTK